MVLGLLRSRQWAVHSVVSPDWVTRRVTSGDRKKARVTRFHGVGMRQTRFGLWGLHTPADVIDSFSSGFVPAHQASDENAKALGWFNDA